MVGRGLSPQGRVQQCARPFFVLPANHRQGCDLRGSNRWMDTPDNNSRRQ
jgi:hypothetical protein